MIVSLGILLALVTSGSSSAQIGIGGGGLPNNRYYAAFGEFYDADYVHAGEDFGRGARSAYRVGEKRYLDSVCYWTMVGECYYHLGKYGDALDFYERALDLYVSQLKEGWQRRVELPATISARQNAFGQAKINWGAPKRQGAVANIPRTMTTLFGRLDAARAFTEGGLVNPAEQRGVDVKEIMRCTALALHRRRNILGATAKYSSISTELVSALSSSRGSGLFRTWNNVLLGIAQATVEDYDMARNTLTSSLQFNGGMDHNLTPVALVTLAQIAFVTNDRESAAQLALEASYSAAMHNQYDLVEESLSLGTIIHLMSNKTPYPPLEPAIQWAANERAKLLNASMIERLAACQIEAGDISAADSVLRQAKQPMRGNSLSKSVVNSRLRFISAQLAFLRGDVESGMDELEQAIADFQNGSRWIFQLGLADARIISGEVSSRRADQLYSSLLRDPTSTEWLIEPFECLAFLQTPHVAAMERWFEVKLDNKQYDKAIEVAELVRRHRFYANLPLAGRLLAFRWMLEGPEEALTKELQDQRKKFLNQDAGYAQLSDRAKAIRAELVALPLKPDADSPELKKQLNLFVELAEVSRNQESIIASYAVRRQPADIAFPPHADLSSFHNQIQPHQIAYVSLLTRSGLHVFTVTSSQQRYLGSAPIRQVGSTIIKFLKKLGLQDASGGVDIDLLSGDSWIPDANRVANSIFVDGSDTDWSQYKELVVIPDGVLWYVPFELLQLNTGAPVANRAAGALDPGNAKPGNANPGNVDPDNPDDARAADPDAQDKKPKKQRRTKKDQVDPSHLVMLGDQIQIRYSPTLFLAFGAQRPDRTMARTAVMSSRMHPKGEFEVTAEAVKKLQADISDAVEFSEKMKIPSNYFGAILDRMVVFGDIKPPSRGGAFAISPANVDKGLKGSNLASWLSLPFWGPEHIVLPGFTSGGAAGGRGRGDGQDIFLTACGLLASGSRSIMLSRWRVGGENSLELARRYAKNLSEKTPAAALKDSVAESKELDVNYETEPRVKPKKAAAPMKADHPFFWAGHMVIEVPNRKTAEAPGQDANDVDVADPADVQDPADGQPPAKKASDKTDRPDGAHVEPNA